MYHLIEGCLFVKGATRPDYTLFIHSNIQLRKKDLQRKLNRFYPVSMISILCSCQCRHNSNVLYNVTLYTPILRCNIGHEVTQSFRHTNVWYYIKHTIMNAILYKHEAYY